VRLQRLTDIHIAAEPVRPHVLALRHRLSVPGVRTPAMVTDRMMQNRVV
jgi:hypothetical protein